MKLRHHWAMLAAVGLILLTNAAALSGVAYNRSGSPEAILKLSERELFPPRLESRSENSGLALNLRWRVLATGAEPELYPTRPPGWLNEGKMLDLGFKAFPRSLDRGPDRFQRQAARDVLLVLELDGDAYKAAVKRAEAHLAQVQAASATDSTKKEAARMLSQERTSNSRLFVVDAGLDAAALRAEYPDRSRFAIVGGQVSPSWMANDRGGMVTGVNVDSITVPLQFRPVFDEALKSPEPRYDSDTRLPPFLVSVAYGQRLEPWIVAASKGQ